MQNVNDAYCILLLDSSCIADLTCINSLQSRTFLNSVNEMSVWAHNDNTIYRFKKSLSITHPVTALACWRRQGCIDLPSWPAGCVCNKGSGNGQTEESQTGSCQPAWLSTLFQTEHPADIQSWLSSLWCYGSWWLPAAKKSKKKTGVLNIYNSLQIDSMITKFLTTDAPMEDFRADNDY